MSTGIVPVGSWNGQELRAFNDADIQGQIDRALAHLTPGRNGAVIAYYDQRSKTISGAVVARFGNHVSVVGTLSHTLGASMKDLGGGAAVRYEW